MQPIVTKRRQPTKFSKCYALQHSLTTLLASSDVAQLLCVNQVEVTHLQSKENSFNNRYCMYI